MYDFHTSVAQYTHDIENVDIICIRKTAPDGLTGSLMTTHLKLPDTIGAFADEFWGVPDYECGALSMIEVR